MNRDTRLFEGIKLHIRRPTKQLADMVRLAGRFHQEATDLLQALIVDQTLTKDNIKRVLEEDISQPPVRAIDVHTRVAEGRQRPPPSKCVALYSVAYDLLGSIQGRQAIFMMHAVRTSSLQPTPATLQERILSRRRGVNQAIQAIRWFRFGVEPGIESRYLDAIAVLVQPTLRGADGARGLIIHTVKVLRSLGFCLAAVSDYDADEDEVQEEEEGEQGAEEEEEEPTTSRRASKKKAAAQSTTGAAAKEKPGRPRMRRVAPGAAVMTQDEVVAWQAREVVSVSLDSLDELYSSSCRLTHPSAHSFAQQLQTRTHLP